MEVNIHGKSDSSIDINNPQSENWEGVFLSPNHPEVNQFYFQTSLQLHLADKGAQIQIHLYW